jgi:hypothetical protein
MTAPLCLKCLADGVFMPLHNCRGHNLNAAPHEEDPITLRRARNARAYYRNRASRMERMRKYYEAHKKQQQARFKTWYAANSEALLERRRAQRRQAE